MNIDILEHVFEITFIAAIVLYYTGHILLKTILKKYSNFLNTLLLRLIPFIIIGSIVTLYFRLPTILLSGYSFPVDFISVISILVLIMVYAVIAFSPAEISASIVSHLNLAYVNGDLAVKSVWTLLQRIRLIRQIVVSGLIMLILVFSSILIFLTYNVMISTLGQNSFLFMFVLIAVILFILYEEFGMKSRHALLEGDHGRNEEIKQIINTLSVRIGIEVPSMKIVKHNKPNAFSQNLLNGKSIITITTGLLNVLNKRELEAVLAHELAHLYSGISVKYKEVRFFLSVLKVVGFTSFYVFLFMINPVYVYVWVLLVLYTTLQTEGKIWELVVFANPPYVLTNAVSYLVYYTLSFNEDLFADIKAVEMTRHPQPLYSAISKLHSYKDLSDNLPSEHYFKYFWADTSIAKNIPLPQADFSTRTKVLQYIDSTLKTIKPSNIEPELMCPACGDDLIQYDGLSHYGLPVVLDVCGTCGSTWFDKSELWYSADLTLRRVFEIGGQEDVDELDEYDCPRCFISMDRVNDSLLPQDLDVHKCPTCEGNWMHKQHLQKYSTLRIGDDR